MACASTADRMSERRRGGTLPEQSASMTESASAGSQKDRRGRRRAILGATAVLVLVAAAASFFFVGRWLVVEDALGKAQAIAVLSGGMPFRAEEAAALYKEGYAPQVWLTHSTKVAAELKALGIEYAGEDVYDAEILKHLGVPAEAIRVLGPPIENTADEIRSISGELKREHGTAVIIVTSKAHTRRTRLLWRRLAGGEPRAIVREARLDPFNPRRWWSSTTDALEVVREVLGVLNAWAGLPLKPSR